MMTDISRRLRLDSGNPATILVGITYGGDEAKWPSNRSRDLTPAVTEENRIGGGARAFLSFIKEELVPVIDARDRTGPGDRILSGASYARLFTLYALTPGARPVPALPGGRADRSLRRQPSFALEQRSAEGRKDLQARVFISAEGTQEEPELCNSAGQPHLAAAAFRTTSSLLRQIPFYGSA